MEKQGSYSDPVAKAATEELGRLRQQASILADMEREILLRAGLKPATRVLELGCGPGFVTDLLTQLAQPAGVVSMDLSLPSVRHLAKEQPAATPICASATAIPFRNDVFDFSYARFLIQHVPDQEAVIQETFRVLKPGGTLLIVDSDDGLILSHPADPELDTLLAEARSIQQSRGGDRLVGRKLPVLLASQGFTDIRSRVLVMDSISLGFQPLTQIMLGFKASLCGQEQLYQRLLERLGKAANEGRFYLAAGIVVAWGAKPEPESRDLNT